MTAEQCVDAIKEYLIGMVESWNNNHSNLHAGITSIVSSFDGNKDYKYLSLRWPSGLDSGIGTCASTSSLPRRSRPSKESPVIPPRPKASLTEHSQLHKFSLQDLHTSSLEGIHGSTVSMAGVENHGTGTTFPRTSNHEPTQRVRRINVPIVAHGRRSYVTPEVIQRRISAPWRLVSGLGTRPMPVERKRSHQFPSHQSNHPPNLPHRSHSAQRGPIYPPPLPRRIHSESVGASINTLPTIFSPTLDDFNEDEEENDGEARYATVSALEYIAPKKHTETGHEVQTNHKNVKGRPNIGKLQKKLWKRNSTLRKGKRPSVHKRSLTHSSDASSDDSDIVKRKPRPQRRVSSYHPPRRISLTKLTPTRRKTADSFPDVDSPVENTTADVDQSNALPDQENGDVHVMPASDGDNEESECNGGRHSGVRLTCTYNRN